MPHLGHQQDVRFKHRIPREMPRPAEECGLLQTPNLHANPHFQCRGGISPGMDLHAKLYYQEVEELCPCSGPKAWLCCGGAGQSSTITGVYTGQFVMSGFLNLRISQWKRISITRSVALVPTLLVSLLYRQPGGTELDILNEWLNVLQSVQIPFALLPVSLPLSSCNVATMLVWP